MYCTFVKIWSYSIRTREVKSIAACPIYDMLLQITLRGVLRISKSQVPLGAYIKADTSQNKVDKY